MASQELKINDQPNQAVNRYTMTVDINGFKYSHETGVKMSYQEIADYWSNKYPVRILTIDVPFVDIQGIVHSKKTVVNNREMYDINIMVKPLDNASFQNKPFVDGMFKAILRDGDFDNDFTDSINAEDGGRMASREQGVMMVPMVFYLYKMEELKYSQVEINLVINNPTLSQAWLSGFSLANPNLKTVVSKFDHNPNMGILVIPPTGYPDYLSYLEDEVGFYDTDYMDFVEHGVYFLLNKKNKVNCSAPDLEYKLVFTVGRSVVDRVDQYVRKLDEKNYELSVGAKDMKITISNNKSFGQSIKYIPPSGAGNLSDRGLSRNYDVVYKTTEIPHIKRLENPIYEFIEINMNNNSVNFITPLTVFTIQDSTGRPRIYRVCGKYTTIQAGQYSSTKIKGFRLL